MFRNYLATAWRNAIRDRLHTVINVLGLAIGLAATILIALFIRHELSFDDFLTDSDHVYRLSMQLNLPGRPPALYAVAPKHTAPGLILDFPEFAGVARLVPGERGLRHGTVEAIEDVYWADPSFLKVMGLKTIAGDAATALDAPDSVILTRRMAEKYFGSDTPIGATFELGRNIPAKVTAVIDDLPSNSHLATEIIASGRSPTSPLAEEDAEAQTPGDISGSGYLYVRLKPGVSASALAPRLADFIKRHFPLGPANDPNGNLLSLKLEPVRDIHFLRSTGDMKDSSSLAALTAIGIVGALILVIAAINFVNLMTARAARRSVEVGVRKALGATQGQLIMQFMGEAIGFAVVAALLAIGCVELTLPNFNAVLDRRIALAYWQDPGLTLGMLALVLVVGLGAGLYPALVLASFRPAAVLKSARATATGGGRLRQVLVVVQFAASIGLVVSTLVITRQTAFATGESLHFDKEQVLLVRGPQACVDSFRNQVKALPGVRGAACSGSAPLSFSISTDRSTLPDGRTVDVDAVIVDHDYLALYGLQLLAGRNFDRNRAEDAVPTTADAAMEASIIINETAVRDFGFANPAAAIGQEVSIGGVRASTKASHIIGVIPDFPIGTIRQKIQPSVFFIDPSHWALLSVKLTPGQIPETLAAIDRIWSENVADAPIRRMFLDSEIEKLYRDAERQGRIFAAFSLIAVTIGCLGMFGLSAFSAERRTKEIGIRKALGASTADVARLLIWQFIKPVLTANVIAWPITWWFMHGWLDGFAYRIELSWPPFVIGGIGAVVIAVATTGFHALQVARARPVTALRYE